MKTPEARIRHLFRRYGFGASPREIELGLKLGVDGTLKHLIDYQLVDEQYPVSPYEFCWRGKDEADPGTWNFRQWWLLRMLATRRPLQEKLTLFWHNHFAVSDAKVEDGPMMLQYNQALRAHANGSFGQLLTAISTNPAMLKYLDMQKAYRGRPNENFAREVMELFTLGIGNYTEKDVQEASRALTGWGYVHIYWELGGTNTSKLEESIQYDRPFSSFTYMPAMRDDTEKTILGKKGDIDGYGFLDILATHPATARYLSKKLLEFFVYPDPEEKLIDRVAKVFTKTKGDIKAVLYAMAKQPEFFSEKAERAIVKSPVDFVVPICRQQGVGEALLALRDPNATTKTRIAQRIPDNLWGINNRMEKSGLALFWPPDVSGWNWGEAWVSPASMIERMRFRGALMWGEKGPGQGATNPLAYVQKRGAKDTRELADAILDLFDIDLRDEQRKVVAKVFDDLGGMDVLKEPQRWLGAFDRAMAAIVAAPEAHMC